MYSKSAKSRPIAGFGSDLGSSVNNAVNMETLRYQQQAALPNQHDNDAKLFSDLQGSLSRPGGRPRGVLANLASGALRGLEHGARSQGVAQRQANYEKYAEPIEYLMNVQKNLVERNQRAAEQEEQMAAVRPYATAGLEISYSGMPYEQGNQNMRALVDQLKINNPDFKGDYVGYVPNSPIVNIRDADGNIQAISLSSIAGEDIVTRVQGNYINQQTVANQAKSVNSKLLGKDTDNTYGSIPISSVGKNLSPFMNTINSEINLAKDVPILLHDMDEAERIMASDPLLGQAWTNYAGNNDYLKDLTLPKETREKFEKVKKIAERVAEAYIKAKQGAISDSERHIIQQGLFKVTNSFEGNKYNMDAIRRELKIADKRGEFAGEELAKGRIATARSFQKYMEDQGEDIDYGVGNSPTASNDGSDPFEGLGELVR